MQHTQPAGKLASPASPVGDSRFYQRCGPFSLADVAHAIGGGHGAPGERMIAGLAPLQSATCQDLSFVNGQRHRAALVSTLAGVVIVPADLLAAVPATALAIVAPRPAEAWALAAALFHPVPPANPGRHPSACVEPGAILHHSAEIGAFAHIGAGARIGPRCRVGSHATIGPGVRLGADCRIGASASLTHAELGDRVYIFPGVRIGQEGFGFSWGTSGFVTAPQLGRVLIGDDVEIGANTTIDRGSVQDTVIGTGTRIDNLVQIGHNVRIGRHCVIVAQVGIAGSTVLDDFVQVGGQAALAEHLHVGTGARIGAQAGLIADAPAQSVLLGSPAQPRRDFFRQAALLRRMTARRPVDPG